MSVAPLAIPRAGAAIPDGQPPPGCERYSTAATGQNPCHAADNGTLCQWL